MLGLKIETGEGTSFPFLLSPTRPLRFCSPHSLPALLAIVFLHAAIHALNHAQLNYKKILVYFDV